MARWRPFLRKTWWLWLAGTLLWAVFSLEAASRFDPGALAPVPGPLLLDRHGQILRLVPDSQGRKAVCLPAGPLPPLVVAAFLATEDQRFWEHPGWTRAAVFRAALQNLTAWRLVSGASTITQQLARLTYPGPRTFRRKAVEMVRSLRIEGTLSKEEILRCYLNRVPLGYNLVGVEAAALAYFGKGAADLTASQAALLASLAKAPGTLDPTAAGTPGCWRGNAGSWGAWPASTSSAPRNWRPPGKSPWSFTAWPAATPVFPFQASHFVQLALSRPGAQEKPPRVLNTTLDLSLQQRTEAALRSHRARLLKCGASQAACVVVDNRTLGVLALAGSYRYSPKDQGYNNGAAALRSPGSTLEPFLYAQALDLGFTPATVLEDVERRYRTPRGEFHPGQF